MNSLDLDAYFARIRYTGGRDPSLATLQALQFQHVCNIPFENLDVLLGRGIQLDLASLEEKLVRQRRGGYCFEQNTLFAAVLRSLGFDVTPLAARVRWQVPAEVAMPLTHMLLLVECEGRRYIADVGFGSMSVTAPLALEVETPQTTFHELRRLVRRPPPGLSPDAVPLWIQQAQIGNDWQDVYHFTLEPQSPLDYEVGNWFTSTHPRSRFVLNLTIALADEGRRYTIFNREFTTRYLDGRADKHVLASPDELLDVMARHFNLKFPAGMRFGRPGAPWPS